MCASAPTLSARSGKPCPRPVHTSTPSPLGIAAFTVQAVRVTWVREGLGGFYKGLLPSLLRVMPQSAITLTVYERLLVLLGDGHAQQGPPAGGAGDAGGEEREGAERRRQKHQQPPAVSPLTEGMRPLVVAVDSQAEN
jgi:hypothetical protein